MTDLTICKGYTPGVIGRIAELHGRYYHRNWGFGLFFEAKVATELSEFMTRYDDDRDGIWIAVQDNSIEGAVVIDGANAHTDGAHLRWFILSDALRGHGAGNRLIDTAMDFCRQKGYPRVYLWTFKGLHAARHLYEKAGFSCIEQHNGRQWGTEVCEQRFELLLAEKR